ncbi:pentatricopeptide repeat-containing protein At5g03800-like [Pistacia vera]|uniref:pentatricopeptide repeat-containing protein At5g03800-like n=1 Tax=Pistacia vera TaxID=55513 RepID=UPI001262DB39|nr:pentatricopeptide repeat-containing protein At5g03800-like [Pistacia vera]
MATTTTIIQPKTPFLHFFSAAPPPKPKPHFLPFSTAASEPLLSSHHQPLLSSYPLNTHSSSLLNYTTTNIDLDVESFFTLLRLSVQYDDVPLAKAVHASIVKLQEEEYTRLGNPLISAYLKLGLTFDAYKVFSALLNPNVVSFTSLVSGFAKSGREEEAIELFFRMRDEGIQPNEHSFVAILTACIRLLELNFGLQVHGLIVKMGYLDSVFVANALMGLYGKFSGLMECVLKVFDEMSQRDIASWNTAISSLLKELKYEKAFELFRDMKRTDGFRVDYITISTLLTAFSGNFGLTEGRALHAHAIRIGLEGHLSVNNGLIGFYTKCGSVKDVEVIFERMPIRDVITWTEMIVAYMEFGLVDSAVETFDMMPEKNCVSYNALLAGFCKNGRGMRVIDLFVNMVEEGLVLTDFTLTSVISACGLLAEVKLSEQIHGFLLKFGFSSNACIESALLDMLTRCGRMADADKMFHQWPSDQGNSINWTSMLCGYARNGQPENAIFLFHRGQSEGLMVMDEVAITSVLSVCGTLGFLEMGKQIHCHALKTGFSSDVGVGNSITSMYFKCCNMNDAIRAFHAMPSHDIVSWNGLIAGHLLYRQGDDALNVWSRMENAGIKPDAVTFVLIISAYRYTNSNLVDSCRKLFLSMKTIYNIEPSSEHYASLVGVLGYWGFLEEAEEMVNKMPFEPKISVWRALLDSCRARKNTTMGKRVAKHILTMDPQDAFTYVLISNLYSASGRWRNSEMVREDMREKGFQKHPSKSWIIHQNKVHSFYTRDKSHPQEKEIYSGLEILILECLKAGYLPDTSYVLHEVEEYQKKDFLFYHSAKLAATFGLLTTQPGKPIRILKNILVCGDCHTFLKYVSDVARREIVLRDASGFHHFSDGQCSCKDFW